MPDIKWTSEQTEGIEYSGSNILLAAAAGSGKTAVLTERVIRKILDAKDKTNIDDLLILTFTEAVAGEMKQKTSGKIMEQALNHPNNKHLLEQSIRVNRANISTIHSFCLEVIKNNIHLTNIPAEFSIGSENECDLLKNQALSDVLDSYYNALDKKPHAAYFFDGYGSGKSDTDIREIILNLYRFSRSMPYPKKWLYGCLRTYKDIIITNSLAGTLYENEVRAHVKSCIEGALELYPAILDLADDLPDGHKYIDFLKVENCQVEKLYSSADELSWDGMFDAIGKFKFGAIPTPRKPQEEWVVCIQERIKSLRNIAKDRFSESRECLFADEERIVSRMVKAFPAIRALVNIVIVFDKRYKQLKRQRNILDFNDLEHEMIALISDKNGHPTALAKQLSQRYKEILIDEYQDINALQDTIFRLISRDEKNIFMVGDIKQSIYKFRAAVPALFLEKYHTYAGNPPQAICREDTGLTGDEILYPNGHLIKLYQNFRSRDSVINAVNFVFRACMSAEVGDVEYDFSEKLRLGAEYSLMENKALHAAEMYLIEPPPKEEADGEGIGYAAKQDDNVESPDEELDKYNVEAILAARRIREIIDGGEKIIYDRESGEMRAAKYRDFVILSRTMRGGGDSGIAAAFEKRLFEANIPVYSAVGSSYLTSVEVATILSFLQIIDNPLQDIPLIAVMRSPMFKFDADHLVKIRLYNSRKNIPFYMALTLAAKDGDEKSAKFIKELTELRQNSYELGVDQLIWHIYERFGYFDYVVNLPGGSFRQANLRLLFERAGEFEKTGFKGLFNFNNYINTIILEDRDLTPAKTMGENEDVVRIMSVHTSKGLEFPIVILAGAGKQFNTKDITHPPIIWHEKMGLGADYINTGLRVKYPSLSRRMVKLIKRRELISEEMRLLYVALTRAKEKLIIIGSMGDSSVKRWSGATFSENGRISSHYAKGAKSTLDWLVPALAMHPEGQKLRDMLGYDGNITVPADFELTVEIAPHEVRNWIIPIKCEKSHSDLFADGGSQEGSPCAGIDKGLKPLIDSPSGQDFKGLDLLGLKGQLAPPVKLSVSEIKRQQMNEDDLPVPYFKYSPPSLTYNKDAVSGVLRGTITHFIIQHIDEGRTESLQDVTEQITAMVTGGMITQQQADAVSAAGIYGFYQTPLGKRLKNSKEVKKEVKFYLEVPVRELYPDNDYDEYSNEKILVQGVVDCYFIEEVNGKQQIVIVDYKTDSVSESSAPARAKDYKVQLEYYARGLKDMLGLDIAGKYLYFLSCGAVVEV